MNRIQRQFFEMFSKQSKNSTKIDYNTDSPQKDVLVETEGQEYYKFFISSQNAFQFDYRIYRKLLNPPEISRFVRNEQFFNYYTYLQLNKLFHSDQKIERIIKMNLISQQDQEKLTKNLIDLFFYFLKTQSCFEFEKKTVENNLSQLDDFSQYDFTDKLILFNFMTECGFFSSKLYEDIKDYIKNINYELDLNYSQKIFFYQYFLYFTQPMFEKIDYEEICKLNKYILGHITSQQQLKDIIRIQSIFMNKKMQISIAKIINKFILELQFKKKLFSQK